MTKVDDIFLGMEVNDLVAIGSLGVAFAALFIAPLINARNSKRQVLAPMRQVWINTLRDKISELISIVSISRLHICPNEAQDEDLKIEAHKEDRIRYEKLKLIASNIELHINPSEAEHRDLVSKIHTIVAAYHNNQDLKNEIKILVTLGQKILKAEWEVTKKT